MDRQQIFASMKIHQLRAWAGRHSRWLWAALIATTGIWAAAHQPMGPTTNTAPLENDSVDTYIPAGYVLVPIEVVNYEALDSVLGQFGIVDLFAADANNTRKSRLIASRIRILRAPRNPSHFAVLAPTEEAPGLVRYDGGFFVVVRNPDGKGTRFETATPKSSAPASRRHRSNRLRVEMTNEEF